MEDLISRDYLREIVGRMSTAWEYGAAVSDIYDIIMKAPTVDAVPVVRCGECRMRNNTGYCPDLEIFVGEHFFCAYGRRETNVTERTGKIDEP